MPLLPASTLRSNLGTWAVPTAWLPAVAAELLRQLPAEPFDPRFQGQALETTYFDSGFRLRKARRKGKRYLTLRVRCYAQANRDDAYALSAKTEAEKFRQEIDPRLAHALLSQPASQSTWTDLLPANLAARLLELLRDDVPEPIVTVCCRRYAVENAQDRLTLDVAVHTDTGRRLPYDVLEFKSTDRLAICPVATPLRPIKLSKFLWSTT
jgi:hypothetical protein